MIVNPCKDCTVRHEACWSSCSAYRLWKAEQAGALRALKRSGIADGFIRDGYHNRKEPFKKR